MNFSRLPSFFIGSHARFGETIRSRTVVELSVQGIFAVVEIIKMSH